MSKTKQLRTLLEEPGIMVVPGIYDAITARLAEQVGFEAVFTSGFGLAASALGLPDMGLMTMTESLDRVRHIARSVNIPVVADTDTGYGNELNVVRTVEECLSMGVAGIILEDQEWPKKCGHFEGKRVIPTNEHVQKIKAAIHARGNEDLIIVARTDAREPLGVDEAIKRGLAYSRAGADVIFVEAPLSVKEMERVAKSIRDTPLFANMIEGGKTPFLTPKQLEEMGYKIMVFALSALLSATRAAMETLRNIKEKGTAVGGPPMLSFPEFQKTIGVKRFEELERLFTQPH
ncbi:MAG: isocitrate lyase/PEP mutase family protein [Thaumarchaeota archaeon]|nr:isocitrate lyase/PEP mutase family protein [Nitrososphaerota archaeon]